MIQYALVCENGHTFDAWFRNAAAYDEQHAHGIVGCPVCNSGVVGKALMAPAVARTDVATATPPPPVEARVPLAAGHPRHAELREALRALRARVTAEADYVGDRFADEARRIHFEEAQARGIYGEATRDEVAGLIEDGVDFMPLPALPEEHN